MKINNFQDLKVWNKAHILVSTIYKLTKTFPEEEKFGLVTQIRRSVISICANMVEGYMKSRKDFLRFLEISRGSLEETKYHLILSKDLGYCSVAEFNDRFGQAEEIGKMLYGLSQKLNSCF